MYYQIPGYSAVYGGSGQSGQGGQSTVTPSAGQITGGTQQNPYIQSTLPTLRTPSAETPQQNQSQQSAPITDLTMPAPVTTESMQYLNGFLRTQIGKRVRIQFLIGTNSFLDKMGKLLGVGANYVLLQEAMSDDLLVCDFFTIKFITIYE